ncbi:hypothetical protein BLNAU_24390 [Blattamonas nauphoetae]|uniref:Uncharacterized protein n=1 Tax=Blattamonas nauphoetae TaxID=2049346 RepID=A0ABQ9WMK6_9EUKA|nr:hypothetical protein BLNAU_24390 [Blattamonas nauphoetae]
MTTEDEIAILETTQINPASRLTHRPPQTAHPSTRLSLAGGIVLSLSATVNSVLQQMVKGSFKSPQSREVSLHDSGSSVGMGTTCTASNKCCRFKSQNEEAAKTVKTKPKSQQKSVIEEEELELPNDLATVVPLDTFCPLFDNAVSTLKSLQYSPRKL